MNNLKIAWRNLWRNKKRTLITVASILFGVFFSTLMTSVQEGSYSGMIDNVVKFYSGYIQIHQEDYWDNKTINNSFVLDEKLLTKINSVPEITHKTTRIESFALVSSGDISQGAIIIGINPINEDKLTNLSKWVKKGNYLSQNDDGILMGALLAKYLKAKVNDTVVLLGQGYHGVGAADKFVLKGILDFPSPELSKRFVYMGLENCRDFYSAYNISTSVVLMVEDPYDVPKAKRKLKKLIKSPYKVMTWKEMQPELVNVIASDRAGGVIMKVILYMIIGFGIFSTIMMMMSERKREFGVVIAIGMQRNKLNSILIYETILIGCLGVILGFLISIPVIAYYYVNPIVITGDAGKVFIDMGIEPLFLFSWKASVFYYQAIIIFILTLIAAIYPVLSTRKLEIIKALKA